MGGGGRKWAPLFHVNVVELQQMALLVSTQEKGALAIATFVRPFLFVNSINVRFKSIFAITHETALFARIDRLLLVDCLNVKPEIKTPLSISSNKFFNVLLTLVASCWAL